MTTELTDLEKSLLRLNQIIRHRICNSTHHSGLQFKEPHTYLTSDGYSIGSVVWYMVCHTNDRRVFCFGRTPEQAVENAIKLYEAFVSMSDSEFRKFVIEFEKQQKEKADEYARYVNTTLEW